MRDLYLHAKDPGNISRQKQENYRYPAGRAPFRDNPGKVSQPETGPVAETTYD